MACLHIDGTTGSCRLWNRQRCVRGTMQRGWLLCDSKGAYEQECEWEATQAIHTYLQVRA
jgi:hypothetical protein